MKPDKEGSGRLKHISRWEQISARLDKLRSTAADGKEAAQTQAKNDAVLAARAEILAQSNFSDDNEQMLDLLVFSLANQLFAIENKYVREVSKLANLTTVPNAPKFLTGLTNHRGEIITVYDIRSFVSSARIGLSQLTGVIILGNDKNEFAILADALDRQQFLPVSEVMPLNESSAISAEAKIYARGITRDSLVILNGQSLLDEKRLYIAS